MKRTYKGMCFRIGDRVRTIPSVKNQATGAVLKVTHGGARITVRWDSGWQHTCHASLLMIAAEG